MRHFRGRSNGSGTAGMPRTGGNEFSVFPDVPCMFQNRREAGYRPNPIFILL
jgi:hypothetical protein